MNSSLLGQSRVPLSSTRSGMVDDVEPYRVSSAADAPPPDAPGASLSLVAKVVIVWLSIARQEATPSMHVRPSAICGPQYHMSPGRKEPFLQLERRRTFQRALWQRIERKQQLVNADPPSHQHGHHDHTDDCPELNPVMHEQDAALVE